MAQGNVSRDSRLHKWCKDGKYKIIEEFISSCNDLPARLQSRRGKFGYTPLHEAVSNGHIKVLQLLLHNGGDANSCANSGWSLLHVAASTGRADCVRVLLDNNANISATDEYGKTPLQMAESCRKPTVVKVLRSAEIIFEVVTNGPNLNELLKIPFDHLESNCLDHALVAAVRNGNLSNIGKIILHGASHIDEALAESRKLQKHEVTATLLMIKAAIANDQNLVVKLYGEDLPGLDTKIKLAESDDLAELQRIVCSRTIETMVPIEISRRCSTFAVRDELLLRTGVDKENGTVEWHGLRLTQLETSWLEKVDWVKVLSLGHNGLTSLPPEMGNYLKLCTKIDLQRNKLREMPHCLLELPGIVDLNLSDNRIMEVPNVPKWSASLSTLDLSYNSLSSLPSSVVAPNLKSLNISYNQFNTFPQCVCTFVELTTLNIAYNSSVRALPSEFQQLKNLTVFNTDGIDRLINPLIVQK